MKHYFWELFKAYIRLIHEGTMIRRRYVLGKENLPSESERYFIVCNHQNAANDPLNIIFSLPRRYNLTVMARANVFSIHPALTRFLEMLGLVPAFRAGWEGVEGVQKNEESFDLIAERVNQRRPFLVFPEGGHTQGHYLDPFTTGAVRMAFHVAKSTDWKEDLFIVPTAHHYSDYFDVQFDFLWSIGKPISIKPYYEEYQEHPYKVMRKLKNQMQEAVRSMMLDMGADDYEQKDFLRCSTLNTERRPDMELPERMKADQSFADRLRNNPQYAAIIDETRQLQSAEQQLGLTDQTITAAPTLASALGKLLLLVVLLPLWIVSLWPNAVCYKLPLVLLRTDKMFTNTYRAVFTIVVLYPLFALITLGVMWGCFGLPWLALLWIMVWLPLSRFAFWYLQQIRSIRQTLRYVRHRSKLGTIMAMRESLRQKLDY